MVALFRLELKNLRLNFWVPIIICYILIPCVMLSEAIMCGGFENAEMNIRLSFQRYMSPMGCWWILFVLRSFIDEEGYELLHVPNFRWNTLYMRTICFASLYILQSIPLFVISTLFLPSFHSFFIGISIQVIWFAAAAYFMAIVTKNTLIPLMVITLIEIFSFIFPGTIISPIDSSGLYFPNALLKLAFLFVSSVILFIAGRFIEKSKP